MPERNDSELLAQYARHHSETAFTALVERYINLVYSTALRRVGNPHAAEEITQAVFIILARKAASLAGGWPRRLVAAVRLRGDRGVGATSLSGWLYQTARLTAGNYLRGEIRRQQREQEAYMQSLLNESAADNVWRQIAPLLDDAMGRLGEKDRNAVVLRFFENKSLAEVGVALGASEDAAKMRVNRALEKLRKFLMRRGIALSGALMAGVISANSVQAAPAAMAASISAAAVAKGAAAGVSTLTLVKGVLNIMAWTKVKIAAVAGVAIILATGTTTVAIKTIDTARTKTALSTLQGAWEGTLNVKQAQLRLALRISRTNGVYRAVMDSIDQGAKDIPIARLSARPDSIRAELPALGALYVGTVSADKTEMSGTWIQLKKSYPLTLKRTTEPSRVAEAMAADEYTPRRDSDLQGAWEATLLAGNTPLRLNLRIAEPTPGTFRAQVDSVDQGARNIPVTSLTYHKPAVRFEMNSVDGVFEGNLNDRGDQLAGTWTQAGRKYPLTFRPVKASAQAAAEAMDYGSGASNEAQGHWQGTLEVKTLKLRIVFHIALMPDGSYSAAMDSPDQGVTAIPATAAQFTRPNVRLEWKGMGAVFTGKLENGRLSGAWHQGNKAFPLQLERAPAG